MTKVYLACPYSHPKRWVRFIRWLKITILALKLMESFVVFSPITHSVPMSWFQKKKDNTHDFWLTQDFPFVHWCEVFMIATYSGWNESFGIAKETQLAQDLGKKIKYVNPKTLEIY